MIVVGGVIPEQDFAALRAAGADAIFPPGTVVPEAAQSLIESLNERLGFASARRPDRRASSRRPGASFP